MMMTTKRVKLNQQTHSRLLIHVLGSVMRVIVIASVGNARIEVRRREWLDKMMSRKVFVRIQKGQTFSVRFIFLGPCNN